MERKITVILQDHISVQTKGRGKIELKSKKLRLDLHCKNHRFGHAFTLVNGASVGHVALFASLPHHRCGPV